MIIHRIVGDRVVAYHKFLVEQIVLDEVQYYVHESALKQSHQDILNNWLDTEKGE